MSIVQCAPDVKKISKFSHKKQFSPPIWRARPTATHARPKQSMIVSFFLTLIDWDDYKKMKIYIRTIIRNIIKIMIKKISEKASRKVYEMVIKNIMKRLWTKISLIWCSRTIKITRMISMVIQMIRMNHILVVIMLVVKMIRPTTILLIGGFNLLGGGGTFIEGSPCMLNVFCALKIKNSID